MIQRIHYSWFICFGCALVLFCTGGLCFTGFSVYLPYMRSVLGFTNTQISVLLFVRSLLSVIGMTFVNRFLKKYEIRRVVTFALIMAAASFLIYAFCSSYAGCMAAAALSGAAYGFGSMIPVSILISRWFNDHRGLALGVCMASTGVSTFIASPVITWLVDRNSLMISYLTEGIFVAVMCVIVWFLLRSMPSCLDLEPLGADHETAVAYADQTASPGMIAIMTAGFLLLGTASNNVASNLSLLYQSVGFDSDRIANVVAFFGISLAVGKCVSGLVVDKAGPYHSCGILFIISIIGCALCCTAGRTGLTAASTAVILIGFGMAVASIAPSAFALRVASEKDYPGILSKFQTSHTLGGLLFTTMPGIIADRTDSYVISYLIMLGAIVVSSIILQRVYHWVVCVQR
ncbi:MAG: MFS transporter [Mogibacterium sp.]|nr:MFS transporter [Mogibacterium sp.]